MNDRHDGRETTNDLERLLDRLLDDPATPAPGELDAETVTMLRQLARAERDLRPLDAMQARVWERVLAASPQRGSGHASPRLFPVWGRNPTAHREGDTTMVRGLGARRRWCVSSLIRIAAVVVMLMVVGLAWGAWPRPASAQAVLQRAVNTMDPAAVGVRRFALRWESVDHEPLADGTPRTVTTTVTQWGEVPNRWRTEQQVRVSGGTNNGWREGVVSDGTTLWSYRTPSQSPSPPGSGPAEGTVVYVGALPAGVAVPMPRIPLGLPGQTAPGATSSEAVRAQLARCYQPQLRGKATVAGRQTWVLDLGPTACSPGVTLDPSGTMTPLPILPPAAQGRTLLWIDTETFFLLGSEHDNPDGTLAWRNTVTAVTYNSALPADPFTFVPPPAATLTDFRPGEYRPQPGVVLPYDVIFHDGHLRATPASSPPP